MLRAIFKCFGFLLGIEFLLFIGLIFTVMTDEKPPAISELFYWPLKYIFGFPLVLINHNYPYFLDGGGTTIEVIFLGMLNNLILACILQGIFNILKPLLKIEKAK
jgi:hypothetical protein